MIRTLVALTLAVGLCHGQDKKPTEAEALFAKVEEKALKSKTLQVGSRATITEKDKDGKVKEQTLESMFEMKEGNKFKAHLTFEGIAAKTVEFTSVSDGKKVKLHTDVIDAPKGLAADVRKLLVRGGSFFMGISLAADSVEDFGDLLTAKEFKLGKDETLNERAVKVLNYTMGIKGEKGDTTVTIWIDAETHAIAKRECKGPKGEHMIEYIRGWLFEETMEDDMFKLPEEGK